MTRLCRPRLLSFSILFAATALTAVLAPASRATTFVKLDLAEMVNAADAIVIGRARDAESVWVGRNLYTLYWVEVQENLLGAPASEVAVVVPGGMDLNRKHPIAIAIPDAPILHRDEALALLLKRASPLGDGTFTIVGFNQGRISIDAAQAGQVDTARQSIAGDLTARAAKTARVRAQLQQLIAARGQASVSGAPAVRMPAQRPAPGARGAVDAGVRRLP